jgi:hypothetical protein
MSWHDAILSFSVPTGFAAMLLYAFASRRRR